ncbi:MAG: polysaccharide deacetylase family protein [Candidatus Levyibacteriota bacterium]
MSFLKKSLFRQYFPPSAYSKPFVLIIVFLFLYGFSFGVQITTATTNSYVPNPHTKIPASLKKIFFIGAEDGENKLSPIKNNNIVFHGSRDKKQIALTFDADMTPWMRDQYTSGAVPSYNDQKLIDELNDTHTKATLFLTGMWIEMYPDVAKELAANSLFELGNHSYSHPSFSGFCYGLEPLPKNGENDEIAKTQSLLFNLTKKQNTLFRFPGGCYSQNDITLLHKKGIIGIQWDVVGDDGFNNNVDIIKNNIFNNVQNGSIIVMHMNGAPNDPVTDEVLPNIISTLKQRGYEFETVSELLAPPPKKEIVSLRTLYPLGNLL